MYAVGFPGMPDQVVQVQHFIVNKFEDGRHLTKSNKICGKHFFIILDRIEGDSWPCLP